MQEELFGHLPDGRAVRLLTLSNRTGGRLRLSALGGALVSWEVPDASGAMADVLLGFDTLEEYLRDQAAMGALVGRYGNRIANGRFSINGHAYQLECNLPPHHLHGGRQGFQRVLWDLEPGAGPDGESVTLRYTSPDGEDGYPGTLHTEVQITLTDEHAVILEYEARCDAPTVLNLTCHPYFNLAGGGSVLEHELRLHAHHITEPDPALIPTGRLLPVQDTPFDFREFRRIGDSISADHPLIRYGGGYDHNFVLDGWDGSLRLAGEVRDPARGRSMEIWTTEPGMQFYTANHLQGVPGKGGAIYTPHCAFCAETQHFPDSPNQPGFPSTLLMPGETYRQITIYQMA
jgi:aldose 1-epimerase